MALKVKQDRQGGWYVTCPDCGVEESFEDREDARETADAFDRCTYCEREMRVDAES